MLQCPNCKKTFQIGLSIGQPSCDECKIPLIDIVSQIGIGAKVTIGGNLHNSGKIKVFENGELSVNKDVINTGDIEINDPEKIKELLIEIVKTSGNLAELGGKILSTFFNKNS